MHLHVSVAAAYTNTYIMYLQSNQIEIEFIAEIFMVIAETICAVTKCKRIQETIYSAVFVVLRQRTTMVN